MDLIERYLQAVQFWLPRHQKQDIIAELSEDLHAQVEEREAALGRALTDEEIELILKQRGRPVLVANRFLPQEHLIGPVLFPIYMFALKIVLLSVVLPWVVTLIGQLIYSPAYRDELHSHTISAVLSAWSNLWATGFLAAGAVTMVFAILERLQAKSHFLEEWDPRKLPAVRNRLVVPRATAMLELSINVIGFIWWARYMYSPAKVLPANIQISLSALWVWFFWGVLILALVNAVIPEIHLLRRHWTLGTASARLLADLFGSALLCWMLKANLLIGLSVEGVAPEKTLQVMAQINYWMEKMFPYAVLFGLVILCVNGYRIVRLKSGSDSALVLRAT